MPLSPPAVPAEPHRAPPWLLPALALAVLLPRLLVFGLNENLYGDAVARTELAQRWAERPHLITSFHDGALQYGPLHITLLGVALRIDPDPLRAGRWVSLVFGVATVWPLFVLTRRLFGAQAAAAACLGLSLWGLHIQCSTTAASEAVTLFFVLGACAMFEQHRWFLAAAALNLAAGLRYDPWLLVPVFAGVLFWRRQPRPALLFLLASAPLPVLWSLGNLMDGGDAFTPIRYTEHYHHVWAREEMDQMGAAAFRLRGLWFWPATAFATLTPGIAALALLGVVRAYRSRPEARWLLWVMLIPAGYYALRILVPANFVPLARFTVPQLALLLPFFALGGARWLLPALTLGVGWTLAMGAVTFTEGPGAGHLRPLGPVSRNPPQVRELARALQRGPAPVLLDASPGYWDLQLAALARLGPRDHLSARWADASARRPAAVVLDDRGVLGGLGWRVEGERLHSPHGESFFRVGRFEELTLFHQQP